MGVSAVIGQWTTSSLSVTNGNCVEVMVFEDGSADVRKQPEARRGGPAFHARASGMTSSPASDISFSN